MAGVTLRFDLPSLSGQAGAPLAPEIDKWIGSLPLLNTAESSRMLLDRLTRINRQALEEGDRLRVLERFREPVHGVCLALIASCELQTLPLRGSARDSAQRMQSLCSELAMGYQRLAADASSRVPGSDSQRAALALYLQRALHTMGRMLAGWFSRYSAPPPGTWRAIHELYRCAEASNIADATVPDPLNPCITAPRVIHAYFQALLLDLAGPYQMPRRMVEKVYRYLDAMAPLAQMTQAIPALRPDCQFVLNLSADRAGVSNVDSAAVTTEARYRFLNTAGLAAAMYAQYQALQKKQAPALHGLAPDFFGANGAEMLKRLLVAWGVHPRRRLPRLPRPHTATEVHIGLDTICQLVNRGLPFERSSNLVGPMPKPPDRLVQHEAQNTSSISESGSMWEMENEGAGGLGLTCHTPPATPINVGELIAVRRGNSPHSLDVAMVSWVMYGAQDEMHLGAKRLSAAAATVGITQSENPDSSFHVALRLPALPALKQAESLITPHGYYQPGRELILDDGMRTHRITATKLTNLTGSFEQFEFKVAYS